MILGKSIFLSLISLYFAVFLMHRTRRGQRTQHNTEVHEYRKVKKEKTHTVCPLPFPSHVSSIATSPYQKANPTIHLSHGLWMRSHVINPAPCFTLSFSRVFLLFFPQSSAMNTQPPLFPFSLWLFPWYIHPVFSVLFSSWRSLWVCSGTLSLSLSLFLSLKLRQLLKAYAFAKISNLG